MNELTIKLKKNRFNIVLYIFGFLNIAFAVYDIANSASNTKNMLRDILFISLGICFFAMSIFFNLGFIILKNGNGILKIKWRTKIVYKIKNEDIESIKMTKYALQITKTNNKVREYNVLVLTEEQRALIKSFFEKEYSDKLHVI